MRGFLSRTVPFDRPFVTGGIAFALALGIDLVSKVLAIAYDVDGKVVLITGVELSVDAGTAIQPPRHPAGREHRASAFAESTRRRPIGVIANG